MTTINTFRQRTEAKMSNGIKEFDFKRCPYCGAVYDTPGIPVGITDNRIELVED